MPRGDWDDKRTINRILIDPKTHRIMIDLANQQGISLSDFIGAVVDEAAMSWVPPEVSKDQWHIFHWNYIQLWKRQRRVQMVYQMAAMYNELGGSEDLADLIERQCEICGVDMTELMLQVQDDPLSSLIAQTRQGTKFDQCLRWLSDAMQRYGEFLVSQLKVLAAAQGYDWTMVNRVKREIQGSGLDVNLISEKRGKTWWWVLADRETGELVKPRTTPLREPHPLEQIEEMEDMSIGGEEQANE